MIRSTYAGRLSSIAKRVLRVIRSDRRATWFAASSSSASRWWRMTGIASSVIATVSAPVR